MSVQTAASYPLQQDITIQADARTLSVAGAVRVITSKGMYAAQRSMNPASRMTALATANAVPTTLEKPVCMVLQHQSQATVKVAWKRMLSECIVQLKVIKELSTLEKPTMLEEPTTLERHQTVQEPCTR